MDETLKNRIILDELFDLTLYSSLEEKSKGGLKKKLFRLVKIEKTHYKFWQSFFNMEINELDILRKIKLRSVILFCNLGGEKAVQLVLESIEIYGIKNYLKAWEEYKGTKFGKALEKVLREEFQHEDEIVLDMKEKQINPERIRSIFLGFNDGLVEMLGAVSGFFAAFSLSSSVLIASSTVAIAGAISMAAGNYAAQSSEKEVENIENEKHAFLKMKTMKIYNRSILKSSTIVGVSYIIGSIIPILPVFFGAKNVVLSFIISGLMIALISTAVSFISGMEVRKRIGLNLALILSAVIISFVIGTIAKSLFFI